jgi:hypothetical protein
LSFADADADARTTAILAAGLALSCRGWNDDAGFLASPATDDSGAATADRDAVAMAREVDERFVALERWRVWGWTWLARRKLK